jgi:hypothetical protein
MGKSLLLYFAADTYASEPLPSKLTSVSVTIPAFRECLPSRCLAIDYSVTLRFLSKPGNWYVGWNKLDWESRFSTRAMLHNSDTLAMRHKSLLASELANLYRNIQQRGYYNVQKTASIWM